MSKKNKKNILVSGYTGFIGSEVVNDRLFNNKYDVVFIKYPKEVNSKSKEWLKHSTFINLSGRAVGSDDEMWASNVSLAREFTQTFLNAGGRRLIHASSYAVYGNPLHLNGSNENDPHKFGTYYGFTKSVGEDILQSEVARVPNASAVIFRLPSLFGENQNKGVIYHFLLKLRQNQEVVIYGNGNQLRQFLHVKDFIAVLVHVLDQPDISGVYNLTGPFSVSMNSLFALLRKESKSKLKYENKGANQASFKMDHSKSTQTFGEFYQYTMRYFKKNYNWEKQF